MYLTSPVTERLNMKTKTKLGAACALSLFAALSLAACSSDTTSLTPNEMMNQSSPGTSGMMMDNDADEASSGDIAFSQMMIPHHEQAVEMSQLAPERASSAFIKDLANTIQNAQQPEIELMAGWLDSWGVPRMTMMDAMNTHGAHGMSGIMSEEDMSNLAAAKGTNFDQLYAELMIAHHEGAIAMAKAVENSSNPDVAALAKRIISAQQAEIAQMQEFLES